MFTLASNSTPQSAQIYSAVSSRDGQMVLVGSNAAPLRISNPVEAEVFRSLAEAGLISKSRATVATSVPLGKTA